MPNYNSEDNFSKKNLRGGRKRGVTVFVGDNRDARRCLVLERKKILENRPSQRSSFHSMGYLTLSDNTSFDLRRGTINGKARYIFKCRPEIEVLGDRKSVERACRRLTRDLPPERIKDLARLVLKLANSERTVPLNPDQCRELIKTLLPLLGVDDLRTILADYSE